MIVIFLGVLFIPWLSTLFALSWLPNHQGLVAVGIGIVGAIVVTFVRHASGNVGAVTNVDVTDGKRKVAA